MKLTIYCTLLSLEILLKYYLIGLAKVNINDGWHCAILLYYCPPIQLTCCLLTY